MGYVSDGFGVGNGMNVRIGHLMIQPYLSLIYLIIFCILWTFGQVICLLM